MSIAEVLHSAAAMTIDTSADKPATPLTASRFVTLSSRVTPVLSEQEFQRLKAHPPASRQRLLKAAADKFASSGASVFVHYAEPILQERRKAILRSGSTKKIYHRTAAQLWPNLRHEDQFFWNEVIARQLRLSLKQKTLSYEECLKYAGKIEDVPNCLYYAESAVCRYLGIEGPDPPKPDLTATADPVTYAMAVVIDAVEDGAAGKVLTSFGLAGVPQPQVEEEEEEEDDDDDDVEQLLDTLQPRFEYTRDMLYGHFARYDLDQVHSAEGRTQVMLLRHLLERLDNTGKELFYYYMVPRLCKQYQPPRNGSTVMSLAHGIWALLVEREKENWWAANSMAKQQLGNGDIEGLVFLELGSLDDKVTSLHDMAERALKLHEQKRSKA